MDDHRFMVVVEHDPYQSYSRAVRPRALRSLNKDLAHRVLTDFSVDDQFTLADTDYDLDPQELAERPADGRALTGYVFEVTPR